jgi:hypothetical protein
MSKVFVLPGNRVEHNGTAFEAGEEVTGCSEKEAKALLDAGVVSEGQAEEAPSEAEVAAAAAEAGGENPEAKKGLFR